MSKNYKDILNLLYIANARIWFNHENTKYDDNAIAGSEDTWNYFWEIAKKNGIFDECQNFLIDNVLDKWKQRDIGLNWYSNSVSYIDWNSEIIPLLEQCGYPIYPDYLRLLPQQLENNQDYLEYRRQEKIKLDEIEPLYNL